MRLPFRTLLIEIRITLFLVDFKWGSSGVVLDQSAKAHFHAPEPHEFLLWNGSRVRSASLEAA
jgi:hypothetical protein